MKHELIPAIRSAATKHGLDPLLVTAVVEQESSYDPTATRFEAGYRWLYLGELASLPPDEKRDQMTSWGLMQVMGAVAREMGFTLPLAKMLEPAIGLDLGCRYLAKQMRRSNGNLTAALSRYNSGRPASKEGLKYSAAVQGRLARLRRESLDQDA